MNYGAALLLGFAAWAFAYELNAAGELNTADKTDYAGQLDALVDQADPTQPRMEKVKEVFGIPWTMDKNVSGIPSTMDQKKFAPWECQVSRNRPLNPSTELSGSAEMVP